MANNRITKSEFQKRLVDKWGDEYSLVGDYNGSQTKLLIRHSNCDHITPILPHNAIKQRIPCQYCNPHSQKNTSIYEYQLRSVFGDEYEVAGEYLKADKPIPVLHKICGTLFKPIATDLLSNRTRCPYCFKGSKIKTTEVLIHQVLDKYRGEYIIDSEYISARDDIRIIHNRPECEYFSYDAQTNEFLRGRCLCPVCTKGSKLINTEVVKRRAKIQYGKHFSIIGDFTSVDDAIGVLCNDCERRSEIIVSYLFTGLARCPHCGRGYSYPEKFIRNVFEQLQVNFCSQYSRADASWCENYRYDFYLPDFNTIIEVHGMQHYKDSWQRKEVTQKNDEDKRMLALNNNISYYVVIDARESRVEFIKNSLCESKLSELIELESVNWDQCDDYAKGSKVLDVYDLFDVEMSLSEISNKTGLSTGTVYRYLVNYSPYRDYVERKKEHSTQKKNAIEEKRQQRSTVICGRRESVKNCLVNGMTKQKIMAILGITQSTLERDMKAIFEGNNELKKQYKSVVKKEHSLRMIKWNKSTK